jgi:hypothetical protein
MSKSTKQLPEQTGCVSSCGFVKQLKEKELELTAALADAARWRELAQTLIREAAEWKQENQILQRNATRLKDRICELESQVDVLTRARMRNFKIRGFNAQAGCLAIFARAETEEKALDIARAHGIIQPVSIEETNIDGGYTE